MAILKHGVPQRNDLAEPGRRAAAGRPRSSSRSRAGRLIRNSLISAMRRSAFG